MTFLLIAFGPLAMALFAILMEKLESSALRRNESSTGSLPNSSTEED